jgi:exopolysaccharide biosynthesis polyprenyl glycosylphosphotransferase
MYSNAILLERFQLSLLRFIATVGAAMLSMWVRHKVLDTGLFLPWDAYIAPALIAGGLVVVVLWSVPARTITTGSPSRVLPVLRGVAIATMILLALSFFYRSESYSRATVLIFLATAALTVVVADSVHLGLMARMRTNRDATRRALLIGYDDYGKRVARALSQDPAYLEVVGYLEDDPNVLNGNGGLLCLGTTADLRQITRDQPIDTVIIASGSMSPEAIQRLIGECMAAGVHWTFVPPMLGLLLDRVQVDSVGGLPLVSGRGDRLVGHAWFIKRSFDIVTAALALILVAPFAALAALAIKIDSRGPVIYRQPRIGMDEQPFMLFKFRTMVHDADPVEHRDYTNQWIYGRTGVGEDSKIHKIEGDPRVTRVGRFLRATSFDEVPQLWNVLRGDMSLVGPRPPISYEVEQYTEWHRLRLSVPPGVTGLWQVTGRNSVSFDDMVRLDLHYIESWSLGLDIRILIRTVPAVVLHRGR